MAAVSSTERRRGGSEDGPRGAAWLMRGDDDGAVMARRLAPFAVVVSVALGLLGHEGQRLGWFDRWLGVALITAGAILVLLAVIWVSARELATRSRERDAALAERSATESRYRSTMEAVGDVVFRTDAAGRWSYLNPAWTRHTGWPVESALGTPSLSFVHPDDRERAAAQLLRLGARERSEARYPHRYLTAAGEVRWAETRVRAIIDAEGELAGYAGTLADVTDRKQAERRLEQSSRHFDLSHDLVATFDREGVFEQLNGAWGPALGWPEGELLGRSAFEIVHPGDRETFASALAALALGRAAEFTVRVANRGGGWRSIEWSASPEVDAGLFYGSGRDITERLEVAEELERERRQLAYAQRLARVGSWVLDPSTGERTWSAQQYRNHGYDPDGPLPAVGEVVERIHPDDVERVREMLARIDAGADAIEVEYRFRPPNSEPRAIEVQGRAVIATDGRRLLIGTSRDVTAERDAERIKDEFIGLVSHELRTPLTSIIGYTELLAEVEGHRLSERGREFVEVIERNSRRELSLVADLLLISQINAGEFDIEIGRADVGTIARASVEAARPAARRAGLTLSVEAPDDLVVDGDPRRIAQVVENLVSNAVKFTPPGGRVTVEAGPGRNGVALSVADTGIGMEEEDLGRLFERMYRSEEAERRRIQGTGLGLTIVKAIVDAHEATIEVASDPGRGSAVRVEFPRRPAPAADETDGERPGLTSARRLAI